MRKTEKKKPKYFSPSLTWKLLWRHLISKCKFSPESCWNMEGGKIYSYKHFVWVPSTILCMTLNFYCTRCLWQVWSAFFLKCISAGRAYNKPFDWDLSQEEKQGITSGLPQLGDQVKDGTRKLTHLPACGNRGTFISERSDVMWGNSGSESHQKTGKCICFFHSGLCCWLDLCKISSVPQTCPVGSVWH